MPGSSGRRSPSTVSSTGRPVARTCSSSSPSRSRPGIGARDRRRVAGTDDPADRGRRRQDAEHPAHVGQRLASGRFDGGERPSGPPPAVVERAQRRAGLDDDDAHVVGDDVVELARDPLALLGDRPGVAFLALALEAGRPFLDRADVRAPVLAHVPRTQTAKNVRLGLDEATETLREGIEKKVQPTGRQNGGNASMPRFDGRAVRRPRTAR